MLDMLVGCFLIILMCCIICLLVYRMWSDTLHRKQLFEVQMEMAKAQQAMTKDLSWFDLKKIIDEVISFNCVNYVTVNGLRNMSDNRITLLWTAILNDVSASVELSLSDEIKRQVLKNISLEYLTKYIKDSVQLIIVNDLENNRNNRVNQKIEYYRTGKSPTSSTTDTNTTK